MIVLRKRRRDRKAAHASLFAEVPGHPPQYQMQASAIEKDSYARRAELPPTPSPTELPPAVPTELPAETR